ncbi:MAG: hypothetical protein ACT4P4_03230 [Betaproteobacteria bacterium]
MHWSRDGSEPEQVRADAADCRGRAWQEATRWSWSPPHWHYGMGFRSHLWPYVPLASPYRSPLDDPFFQESRLAAFCMEAKGYRLVPAEPKAAAR